MGGLVIETAAIPVGHTSISEGPPPTSITSGAAADTSSGLCRTWKMPPWQKLRMTICSGLRPEQGAALQQETSHIGQYPLTQRCAAIQSASR